MVKQIETGVSQPSLSTFLSVADCMGISLDDLVQYSDDDWEEYQAGKNWRPS